MTHKQHTRRTPRQERGEQRVNAILDAAAGLFAEVGYEATTMSEVAERAHTSFGSLYQFFPNKESVAEAVASRYLDQLRVVLHAAQAEEIAQLPLDALVNTLVDPFIMFVLEQPGFQVFLRDSKRLKHLAAAQAVYDESLNWVEHLLTARTTKLDVIERQSVATIIVQLVGMAIDVAASQAERHRAIMINEIKVALRAYLQVRLQETIPPASPLPAAVNMRSASTERGSCTPDLRSWRA